MTSRIRAATLSDLNAVASWIGSARDCELWAGWRVRFPIELASLVDAIGFTVTNGFSLTEGDEVVAFGQLIARGSSRAHLARIIVAPGHRRKGYGEFLVRELIRRAHRDWFERVSLNVDEANAPAIALYAKLGFQETTCPPDEPASPGSRYMDCVVVG